MFKNPFIEDSLGFVIDRANQMQEQMTKLYNQLHHTAYIPRTYLLRPRLDNSKTQNEILLELKTIFKEIKSNSKREKVKKKISDTARILGILELSFLKIKNIKISSTDSLVKEHSLNLLINDKKISDSIMTNYLSLKPQEFIEEVKTINGRKNAYHKIITSFLNDIKFNHFILDELQMEITKHLAKLSEQLNTTLIEEDFWNGVSSSIAKHYIVPVFLEELIK